MFDLGPTGPVRSWWFISLRLVVGTVGCGVGTCEGTPTLKLVGDPAKV